jgi:hypothetical protein
MVLHATQATKHRTERKGPKTAHYPCPQSGHPQNRVIHLALFPAPPSSPKSHPAGDHREFFTAAVTAIMAAAKLPLKVHQLLGNRENFKHVAKAPSVCQSQRILPRCIGDDKT